MTARQKAAKVVDESLLFLSDRGGFYYWWDNIGEEVRNELLTQWIDSLLPFFNDDEE
jgi:hypothetical protein